MTDTPQTVLYRINLWEGLAADKRLPEDERLRYAHYYELAVRLYQKLLAA